MTQQQINDPGIGTSFNSTTKRVINADGTYNVKYKGVRHGLRDVFRYLVEISWGKFFLILFAGYIFFNLLFALIYVICGTDGISGIQTEQNSFLQAFFFSVQTFTTVGYGSMSPVSVSVQSVAAIEAFVGFLSFSLATGLLYGRFSRPRSRIVFSDQILFSPYKDGYSFKIKLANERNSVLLEVDAQLIVTFDQTDENGQIAKKYFRLPLEINHIQLMPFSWTLVHPINEDSPFDQMTKEEILGSNIEFLCFIKAYSEVFGSYIHSRKSYTENDIAWNKNFRKIFDSNNEGIIEMDIRDINELTND